MILRFTRQPDGFSHRLTIETDSGEMLISEILSDGKMLEAGQYIQNQVMHSTPEILTIQTSKNIPAFQEIIDGSFREA